MGLGLVRTGREALVVSQNDQERSMVCTGTLAGENGKDKKERTGTEETREGSSKLRLVSGSVG
jgi:hypothetical protein